MALSVGFFGASCLLFLGVLYDGMTGRLQRKSGTEPKNPIQSSGDALSRKNQRESSAIRKVQGTLPESRDEPAGALREELGTWRARPPLADVLDFQKTPVMDFGGLHYQILGTSLDNKTGEPVVWVRSLTSQRVGKFSPGDQLFGGPVRVVQISAQQVQVSYRGRSHTVPLGA